eukprot:6573586-Pyramimonas_sp.AAC.1
MVSRKRSNMMLALQRPGTWQRPKPREEENLGDGKLGSVQNPERKRIGSVQNPESEETVGRILDN